MTRRDTANLRPHACAAPHGAESADVPAEALGASKCAETRTDARAGVAPPGVTDACAGVRVEGEALDGPWRDDVSARARANAGEDLESAEALDGAALELPARALVRIALAASVAALPAAFPVVWRDGRSGPADVAVYRVEGRDGAHALEQFRADVGALLARPWPKGERGAPVLYPCEVTAHEDLAPGVTPRTSLARAEVTRGVLLVLDLDRGGFRDAWELLRAAGVAAVGYPSPSAEVTRDPLDATKARVLVPVAPCTRAEFTRHVRAVSAVLRAAGVDLDASPLRPESACYVAPRPERGARPPGHALRLDGAAVDLAALDARAFALGWRTREDVARDTAADRTGIVRPRDLSAVFAALDALGVLGAPVGARGLRALDCPRAHWHGSRAPRGARADTSAVVHEGEGWAQCSHDHSGAPEGERGAANLARLVRWCAEDLRAAGREADAIELLARWEEVRRGGAVADVREQLAHAPFGEVPRRTVAPAGIADELEDLARVALRRDGRTVLATPTVGAGKTSSAPRSFRALLLDGTLSGPRDEEHAWRASGGVIVRTRDDAATMAAALVRTGVRARVATPVHAHPAGCLYRRRAEDLYRAGVSARAVLCRDIPADADEDGYGADAGQRCARFDSCAAREQPFVPYAVRVEGRRYLPTVREGFAAPAPGHGAEVVAALDACAPGEPWVAVATHATAGALAEGLRADALLIVDESDVALAEIACTVTARTDDAAGDLDAGDGTTLGDAHAWARKLVDARVGGDGPSAREFTAAPRVIPLAILDALTKHARERGHAALYAIEAPRAWCVEVLARKLAGRSRRAREALAPLHPGGRVEGANADAWALAAHAFAWWERWRGTRARRDRRVAHDPFAVRDTAGKVRPYAFERAPVPATKGASFEAIRRWARGDTIALPLYPRAGAEDLDASAPIGTVLAHRSPSADACAAVLTPTEGGTRGAVLCLDATGDPAVTERGVRGPVHHVAIAVDDAAEVTRTLVYTRDGARRVLCPRGAVQWARVAEQLATAREALRQRGDVVPSTPADAPVVCFTHKPVADALRALVRVEGLDGADGEAGPAERTSVETIPAEARALVRELAAQGWRWSYFGAPDARGSNAWRHVRAAVVCGDARPSGEAMRVREAYARWYTAALDAGRPVELSLRAEDLRDAARASDARARRVASAEHAQCFGRARVTQRVGARVHLVHVGAVPALDWYQRAEGAVRVTAASALLRAARALDAGRARGEGVTAAPSTPEAFALTPPHENAPAPIRVLAAQGWTPTMIAHAMGEKPAHVVAWWEGRRPRQETRLTRARLAALEALASREGEGLVRAWFVAMLAGRGLSRVVHATRETLRRATGLPLDARAFAAWIELPREARRTAAPALRPEVLAALAQLLPVLVRVCPPLRPPPGEPPAALRPVGAEDLAGPVRARGAVVPVLVRDPSTGEAQRGWMFAEDLAQGRSVRPLDARTLAAPTDAAPVEAPPGAHDAAERIARAAGIARAVDTIRQRLRARELATAEAAQPRALAVGAEDLVRGPPGG